MAKLDLLVNAWDAAQDEFMIVLEDLPSTDLWRRADPELWSIGELCIHVCYGEAVWMLGLCDERDLSKCQIVSPLIDERIKYYDYGSYTIVLDINVTEVEAEIKRIHEFVKADFLQRDPEFETPSGSENIPTWGAVLQYQAFHWAYHAGQAFSVRHLMRHDTPFN